MAENNSAAETNESSWWKNLLKNQSEERASRKKKKVKPTEVTVELPVITSEQDNEHGRRRNSAHTPGRAGLPADVFGKHEDARDPAKIVEEREKKKK